MNTQQALPPMPTLTEDTIIRRALVQKYGFDKLKRARTGMITGVHKSANGYGSWSVSCGHRDDYTTHPVANGVQVKERGRLVGTVYARVNLEGSAAK